ncbi:MAG: sulfatase-like hydrolase/transferase [bacterium]|nr:sulfatase-like hydrolase/transferase [bacterium]
MMTRRDFLRSAGGAAAGALATNCATAGPAKRGTQPNILWITCEDISPHFGCYGDDQAHTPNIDALAAQGLRYTNAYGAHGVCAPCRSSIITGMYPSTLGTNHMRCNNPPPAHVRCYPEYLREAGYYCSNNKKTDYQFSAPPSAWDECSTKAHFKNRAPGQPFFAIFNFTITHESKIGTPAEKMEGAMAGLPKGDRHDPAKAQLPPYYPDTPIVRKHWAHYFDLVTIMDQQAGAVLRDLEESGLADDTIVFFYSDHGVGLPRAKRWLYDSGTHVPLVIRWPGTLKPGTTDDRLVSFLDFPATALSLAGVPVPDYMHGRAFLGSQAQPPREYVFGARDRVDERYDIIRAVRDKRFKYLRNYEPYKPYDQYITYCEGWPVLQEMRRIYNAGESTEAQASFFTDAKPVEELYDTRTDPHELRNLAADPKHQADLERLRAAHVDWMLRTEDLAFVPETELAAWLKRRGPAKYDQPIPTYNALGAAGSAVYQGRAINDWVADLNDANVFLRMRATKILGEAGPATAPVLTAALDDPETCVAYWAAVGLGQLGASSDPVLNALRKTLAVANWTRRLGAARALCTLGHETDALPTLLEGLKNDDSMVRLAAVLIIDDLGPAAARPAEAGLRSVLDDNLKYVVRVADHTLATLKQAT